MEPINEEYFDIEEGIEWEGFDYYFTQYTSTSALPLELVPFVEKYISARQELVDFLAEQGVEVL